MTPPDLTWQPGVVTSADVIRDRFNAWVEEAKRGPAMRHIDDVIRMTTALRTPTTVPAGPIVAWTAANLRARRAYDLRKWQIAMNERRAEWKRQTGRSK